MSALDNLIEKADSAQPGIKNNLRWPITILSLVVVLITTVISSVLGRQNRTISDKFHLFVTPPWYFFLIWIAIYLFSLIASIINIIKNRWTLKVHIGFIIANLLCAIFIPVFRQNSTTSNMICALIVLGLFISLFFAWIKAGQIAGIYFNELDYFLRNVLSFFMGWSLAAFSLCLGLVLVYSLKMDKGTHAIVFWISTLLLVGLLFGFGYYTENKKGLYSLIGALISILWAVIGAAIQTNICFEKGSNC